jgi:hypothetical protein
MTQNFNLRNGSKITWVLRQAQHEIRRALQPEPVEGKTYIYFLTVPNCLAKVLQEIVKRKKANAQQGFGKMGAEVLN